MSRAGVLLLGLVALVWAWSLTGPVRLETRVDYELGLVFIERWRGERFLGVEKVIPLEDYLDYQLKESVVENWKAAAERSRQQKELSLDATGLIPDIELPKLPLFGEGSRIDISGQDRITLGGRQTVLEGVIKTPGSQRLLPELKMEQQLAVKVKGKIGERTEVNIDHDSERQEAKNKIRLAYAGTDDDIVESVEVGDTRLSIPGTAYTGDLPAHKGLFGVSAKGRVGGVDVYAIASREESQAQSQSFTGRRQVSRDTIYGRDYVRQRFYRIEAEGNLVNLRVYVDDQSPANNQASFKAIATVFPGNPDSIPSDWSWDRDGGDFDLKSLGSDYVRHPGDIIEFSRSLSPLDVVGVVIFTDQDTIGGQLYNDSLVLKLLKPERTDSLSLTWDYEMRNVYALPQAEVQLNSARLYRYNAQGEDTEYEDAGPYSGQKFVQMLGLDPNGDGQLEYPQFDSKTGLIRFPEAKPFASTELSVRDSVIYRRAQLEADQGYKYYLVVEYSSATESYYLGQTEIEEGSERVRVNGQLWTKGTDYEINYTTGTLSFLRALPPDADISVTFEYRPWFSFSQKSLVGTRAEWKLAEHGKVGTSAFFRSEGTPEDKPMLGSEPFRRMIAEADAAYQISSDDVSAFLDRLPLIRAQAPTTFQAALEGAVSVPDPNTRGVAYLDDFEGTAITRDLSTNAILWYHASVPVSEDTSDFAQVPLYWATPLDRVRKDSVFGPAIGEEGDETQDFLRVVFTPDSGSSESWAGMMTSPSQLGMDLKDIENLQVIMKSRRSTGRMHVSVGMSIDEDAPRRNRAGAITGLNGILDTEDQNQNGILDEGLEDTGLDTVFGADSLWVPESGEDGNDDYDPVENPGGTENNRRLDSEDLDRSGFSRYNHYFEFDIALGDQRYVSSLYNNWELYRIPLHDSGAYDVVGSPKWEDIRLVRLWFDGFEATDTLDFYSVEFVGSKWRDPRIENLAPSPPPRGDTGRSQSPGPRPQPSDSSEQVWVAQISNKTDTTYVSPFQLKRDIYGRLEQEASLLFGYRLFEPGHRAVVDKAEAERDDYRAYRDLRLYVHDDGNGLGFLARIGADSANYYEFSAPVDSGTSVTEGDGKWYEFTIALDSFPRLKLLRDSLGAPGDTWTEGRYRVVGYPSLAEIRYTALGIENRSAGVQSGGVWFDDMRLVDPLKDPGYGFQASARLGLSDLANVGLRFSYSDPNFRRFSEGRGVKTGGFGTDVGLDVHSDLDRLLPHGWGLSIPLSYSLDRHREMPKFSAGYPDLRLEQGQAEAERVTSGSQDIILNNVRKQQSSNRYLNYTLEAMAFSWRSRRAGLASALTRDSSRSTGYQWSYGVSPDLKLELGEETELYLFPQGVRFGLSATQQHATRATRLAVGDTFRVDTLKGRDLVSSFEVDYSPIEDLSFEYGMDSDRDLLVANPDTLWFLAIGSEAGHEENFSANYSMDIGDFISPSAEFAGDYSSERSKRDTVYEEYENLVNSGELDLGLAVELPELLEQFGESGGGSADTTGRSPLRSGAAKLSRVLEPIDIDYSISHSSDILGVYDRAPWHYRFGFSNSFAFDTLYPPVSADRDLQNSARLSSGLRIGAFDAGVGYDWSQGREFSTFATVVDRSVVWPDLDLSLSKVHNLFKKLATDSKLTAGFRRRFDLSGELAGDTLAMYGKTESYSNDFSPLVSWQTTWQKRFSTTLSANYSTTVQTNFLSETGENRGVSESDSRSGELSASYSFSAPKGLKLPFLRKVKFSSDLRLTGSLRYSQTRRALTTWTKGVPEDPVPQQLDNSVSTRLAGSYSFSRTIEAGVNLGYSYTKGLSGTATKTSDLDFWVLFRF